MQEVARTERKKGEDILIFTTENYSRTSKAQDQILSNAPDPSQGPRDVISTEWRKEAGEGSLNVNTSMRGGLNSIINFYGKRHAASWPRGNQSSCSSQGAE